MPWEPEAIQLEQALLRGDAAAARTILPAFVDRFQHERLLFTALADGGEPRQILQLDQARLEAAQSWPQFLPDGKHFIYLSRSSRPGISLGTLGSTQVRRLFDAPDEYASLRDWLRSEWEKAEPARSPDAARVFAGDSDRRKDSSDH